MSESKERLEFSDIGQSNSRLSYGGSKRSNTGCYLTSVTGFILVFLAIAIAVGIGIIVHFAGQGTNVECNCKYPNQGGNTNSQTGDDKTTKPPEQTTHTAEYFRQLCISILLQDPSLSIKFKAGHVHIIAGGRPYSYVAGECGFPSATGLPSGYDMNMFCLELECCVLCPTMVPSTPATTTSPAKRHITDVRLPTALTPSMYDVELTPNMYHGDPEHFTFDGYVNIVMDAHADTNNITMHMHSLTLHNETISVQNEATGDTIRHTHYEYDKDRQFLIFHLGDTLMNGSVYSISMNFTGPLTDSLAGLYLSQYTRDNETIYLATTQFEPTDARKAFPCFDEPAIKSKFKITLIRPENMTSLSNMPIMSHDTRPNGFVADVYATTETMSSYLLAFIVCDFEFKEQNTTSGVLYRAWSRPRSINQTDYALDVGVRIIQYYEDYFNISFPLPKQDMIAIPDFSAGAMENWGLITYRETAMLYDPVSSSASNKQRVAGVIAHELAHQWFGDLVSPQWWDDLWLNEGFASFVEYLGIDHVEPSWKVFDHFAISDLQPVLGSDSLQSSHPIYVPVYNPDEINEIFDSISYNKGSSIIRMMRFILGEETFRWGLHQYLTNRKFKNADHNDLWSALHEQSKSPASPGGVDVKGIMDTWTLQMNYPVVHMSLLSNGNIAVRQDRFLLNKTLPPHPKYVSDYGYVWQIPLTYTTSAAPDFIKNSSDIFMLTVKTTTISNTTIPTPVPTTPGSWIIGNIQQYGYYRVNYDQSNWNGLIAQLNTAHTVIDPVNRAQIINDAWNLAKTDFLHMSTALGTVNYLAAERHYSPWTAASRELSHVRLMLTRSRVYGPFSDFMRNTVKPFYTDLGWSNPPNEIHDNILMRAKIAGLACGYGIPECLTNATQDFNNWMTTDQNTIDVNMKSIVYCNAIRHGGIKEWQFVYDKYQMEKVASEQSKLRSALSCTREPWILSRMLTLAIEPGKFRKQDATRVITGVARNSVGRSLAWDFVRQEWGYLRENYGGGSFSFSGLIRGVSSGFNTQFDLQQLIAFRDSISDAGSGTRAFEQAIESTTENIKWMTDNEHVIEQWLAAMH